MTLENFVRAVAGLTGLVAAMLTLWYLDKEDMDFEKRISVKIAVATFIFSIMMFTPLVEVRQALVIDFGDIAVPSLKWISDTIVMGFMASSLKDIIEMEKEN